MKKFMLSLLTLSLQTAAIACDACKKQQPKFLEGITHGRGPENKWDYMIVIVMTLFTLYVLFESVRYLVRPAENGSGHIKRLIFNAHDHEG